MTSFSSTTQFMGRLSLVLAAAPLVLLGSLHATASVGPEIAAASGTGGTHLVLSTLKDEARALSVPIDGP